MKKGKIVTLATQKGGTGKSTLCLSIGHALHKHFGVKVAIVGRPNYRTARRGAATVAARPAQAQA